MAPATFLTSLGLIEAAMTRTNRGLLVRNRGGDLHGLKNRGISKGLEPDRTHDLLLLLVFAWAEEWWLKKSPESPEEGCYASAQRKHGSRSWGTASATSSFFAPS